MRSRTGRSGSGTGGGSGGGAANPPPRIPPPPSFKPPPLPAEDDGVFIRPITRTRSPHLEPPKACGSLSPVVEVDTPESSRSDSPMSSMSSLSRYSPRNISPAPFVVGVNTFIQGNPAPTAGSSAGSSLGPPKWKTALQERNSTSKKPDDNISPTDTSTKSKDVKTEDAIKEMPSLKIPSMRIEPATPPVHRSPATDIIPTSTTSGGTAKNKPESGDTETMSLIDSRALEHDKPMDIAQGAKKDSKTNINDQKRSSASNSDEPTPKSSKLENKNLEENTERFPVQQENFKPKFQRRASKKLQPKKDSCTAREERTK